MAEINWRRNLWFLWISQLLSMAGFAGIMPFIPLFIGSKFGITDQTELGAWVSAFNFFGMASFCLSNPVWGILADRYGRKLMLLRSSFCNAVCFPLFVAMPNCAMLVVMRFIASSFSGTTAAAQTLIATTVPEKHQGFALGLLTSAIWSGTMLGYISGAVIVRHFGYVAGFLLCGAIYLISGFIVLFFVRENFVPQPEIRKEGFSAQFHAMSHAVLMLLALFALLGFARRFDEPYLAMMVRHISAMQDDFVISWTGYISAAAAAGGILSGIVIGKLCDRYAPYIVALPMLALACIGLAGQGMSTNVGTLAAMRALTYFSGGGLEPAFLKLLAQETAPEHRGAVFGFSMSARMLGIFSAAGVSGVVLFHFGLRQVYFTAAILMLLLLPLMILYRVRFAK
ncbi:MAG: MFS transporter [Victivallaceae bacterium]|nr:MFS transporter [Victivallaceae bacterium]